MSSGQLFLPLLAAGVLYLSWCEQWKIADGYDELPTLFKLQDYEGCMEDNEALYCYVDIELTTKEPSELFDRIKNVSSQSLIYFRHDILHRGICVTRSCDVSDVPLSTLQTDKTLLRGVLQNCVLSEMKKENDFGGNVISELCESNVKPDPSTGNRIFTGVIIAILLLNVAGSIFAKQNDIKQGIVNGVLLSFSIPNNWKKLTSSRSNTEKGRHWVQGLQGIRVIVMVLVILAHYYVVVYSLYMTNPEVIEMLHSKSAITFLFGGTLVVQVYFCLASFLMTYSFLKFFDSRPNINCTKTYFSLLCQRWLRLTPILGVTVGYIVFWSAGATWGPMSLHHNHAIDLCEKYWWADLLYINNIVDGALLCTPQTWYLAVDFQLYCIGMIVIILVCKYPQSAKLILGVTLLAAIITPGLMSYINAIPATLFMTPENAKGKFITDETFLNMYVKPQGNTGGYAIGLICGYVQVYIEKNKVNVKQWKWVPFFVKAIIPLLIATMGCVFYAFLERDNLTPFVSALFASLPKPFIAALAALLIIFIANKCDVGMFSFLESSFFDIPAKVTYGAFIVHFEVEKSLCIVLNYPVELGPLTLTILPIVSLVLSYGVGLVLCLLVEFPFGNIQKIGESTNNSKQKLNNNDATLTKNKTKPTVTFKTD